MKKLSNISESAWGEMRQRSSGKIIRKEDKWFEERVMDFVNRHNLKETDYKINLSDLTVDIFKNIIIRPIDVSRFGEIKLPFKFGKIDGTIWMADLDLKTLENSPSVVTGDFVIYQNKLKDFTGGPEIVGGNFSANLNYNLESLDGSPKKVGGNYSILGCRYIKDISGISPVIDGDLELTNKPFKVFADDEYRKYSNIKGKIIKK